MLSRWWKRLTAFGRTARAGPLQVLDGRGQAFTIGLKNRETFAWIGEFSSGLVSDVDFDLDKQLPGLLKNASQVNKELRLFFLGCGADDPRTRASLVWLIF